MAQFALSYMAFIIHCTQLGTWWGSLSPGPQGKFATSTQGPAKKLEKLDCAEFCITKTKPQYLFRFFWKLMFMNTCL